MTQSAIQPQLTMERLSDLLEISAERLGARSFSLNDEYLPLSAALDPCGPVTWAVVLQAKALAQLTEPDKALASETFPFSISDNPDTPLGKEVTYRPGSMAASRALFLIDSALEHCICIGMKSLGYPPSAWDSLPQDQKVVPIEPYFEDLKENWLTAELENEGTAAFVIANPELYDRQALEVSMASNDLEVSNVLRLPSLR